MAPLVLRNARLVYADGGVVDGGLLADGGAIVEVFTGAGPEAPRGAEVIDAGGRSVLPATRLSVLRPLDRGPLTCP